VKLILEISSSTEFPASLGRGWQLTKRAALSGECEKAYATWRRWGAPGESVQQWPPPRSEAKTIVSWVDNKLKTAGELYEFMVSQFHEARSVTLE